MEIYNKPRSKIFMSMDSLWYEEERLSTFIDWPVSFISARDLAQEGFYYLRTKDHCACAFCRGIIGSWEEGDTPRGEHKRHFPHCPFVQGKVTPNVPLTQGNILAKVSREVALPGNGLSSSVGVDVCGTGKGDKLEEYCSESRILTKSSSAEVSMSSLGFRQYCGPKRKEYLTGETRLNSFKHWPENVKQTPKELSEAGFYYCGLSDHVRCFHCGKGLRNWEPEDDPWVEHARWFPDCHFVLLKKGIEFVDKVRRENPPYLPQKNKNPSGGPSGLNHSILNEDEMDKLMELEIMKHVLEMGFADHVIRKALRKKLMEDGQPFFSVESCIDAILVVMEEETKNTIHGCEDITSQVRKMAALEANISGLPRIANIPPRSSRVVESLPRLQSDLTESAGQLSLPPLPNNNILESTSTSSTLPPLSSSTPTTNTPPPLSNIAATTISSTIPSLNGVAPTSTSSILPLNNMVPTSTSSTLPSLNNISRVSPPLRASTPTSLIMDQDVAPQNMDVEVDVISNTTSAGESTEVVASSVREASPVEIPTEVAPLISEADDIMEEAAKLLGTSSQSSSSSPPSSSASSSQDESPSSLESTSSTSSEESNASSSPSKSLSTSSEESSSSNSEIKKSSVIVKTEGLPATEAVKVIHQTENLEMELQRMRENMMCKVCMDKEMDVVFLPCTHMVTCSSCAVALASCPICRRDIQYAFKPIIS